MVVPWSLPEDLKDEASEPREEIKKIFTDKVSHTADSVFILIISTNRSLYPEETFGVIATMRTHSEVWDLHQTNV